MGKVVTVMNMKGGVGKTTVCMHIAGLIANRRFSAYPAVKKVLIIDYDPQFNLSQAFLSAKSYFALEKARKTTLAILTDDDSQLNPYQLQVPGNHFPPSVADVSTRLTSYTDGGVFDLIPSTLDLMYVALGQASTQLKPIEERFEKFINECRDRYDIVFIDCHPAGSLFTKTSLRNSDHVLIPVVPQRYAVRGIGLMLQFIAAKAHGSKDIIPHILFNRTARVGVSKDELSIRSNSNYGKYCMTNTLKQYGAFSEPEEGIGFVWNSGKPYSGEAMKNITAVTHEFLGKLGV